MPITLYTEQSEYITVQKLLKEMNDDGIITRFQGACLPASEIVQAILHSRGVKSRLLECTALVNNNSATDKSIHFIGFDTIVPLKEEETDTHIVVLVEAGQPFVIDCTIGNKLGNPRYVVVAPLSSNDPDIIAEAKYKNASVTYRVKKHPRFFNIHQKTLIEKLETEKKVQTDITSLFGLVKMSIGIGIFNVIANTVLLILKTLYQ
jgi:hypothetical protein